MACQSQGFISTRSLCVFDKITLFGEPLLSKKSLAISRSFLVLFGTRLLCGSHCLFVFLVLLSTICELVMLQDQTKSILLTGIITKYNMNFKKLKVETYDPLLARLQLKPLSHHDFPKHNLLYYKYFINIFKHLYTT